MVTVLKVHCAYFGGILLRKLLSAILAVQLIVSSALAFADADQLAVDKVTTGTVAADKVPADQAAAEKALAAYKAIAEKAAANKAAADKAVAQAAADKAAADKAVAEYQAIIDKAAADKAAAAKTAVAPSTVDKAAAEKAAADKALADKALAAYQAIAVKAAADKAAAAKTAADTGAADKAASDKALATYKAIADKAAADKAAAGKAATAQAPAAQAVTEKAGVAQAPAPAGQAAADKAAADQALAAYKAIADKAAADKAAAEKAAAEKAAAEKAVGAKAPADKAAADKTDAKKVTTEQPAADKTPVDLSGEHKIAAVNVKGNHRIETSAILQVVRIKPGDLLDQALVDTDLRAIYKLGHFRDVKAEVEKADGGIVLSYLVQEKPVVREIKIEGAKEISADKVRDAMEIKANTIYSSKDLQKSIKKIKKLYADDGYYLAEVEANTVTRSDTELNLVIKINEGKKVLIQTISFEGNHAFTDRKLRKTMETSQAWMFSWLTGAGTYKEEVLKNDTALLTELYMNNGYVNVKIGEPKVELLPDKSGLKVNIGISEGEQYRFGTIGFSGELMESADVLKKKLTIKSGELFNRAALRTDVFALTDLYADKGYAFANAAPQTKITPATHTLDVTFEMEKGELVHIDRINIAGNTKTRDKVVRRELRLEEGELYSSTALKRSKQNLMNTGFFEEANLVTAKGSSADKLDLNVDVKEKPTGTFSVGAGYSSLDGIIGQGSIQQANFLGLGLKGTAAASFGSKSQTYNLGLTDPYFMDTKWTVGADIYRTERQYLDYTRRATGGDIKAGYALSDTLNTFWLYKYEEKQIFDESAALISNIHAGLILAPDPSSTTSAISASLTSNTTDYRIDPSSGMIDTISIEFAGLGGTNRYLRYITEHTLFYPVGFGTVASLRGTFGYIQKIGKDIPLDEKFYLGGISSLRGYTGRTVCPVLPTPHTAQDFRGVGTPTDNFVYLGGEMEAVANLEYTFPLLKDAGLKGVVFFDAGNSADTFNSTFSNVLTSYGAGIRWFSPIGPLRLEYGIPLNPRAGIDKSTGRLEFSIGSIF
jgi:outer membrane protein insertion porin family